MLSLIKFRVVVPDDIRERLVNYIVNEILGPVEDRTPAAPQEDSTGRRTGGTLFERVERPVGIQQSRAYTVATSHQVQNTVYSPVKWGKLDSSSRPPGSVDELPANRKIRPGFIAVRVW